MSLEPNARRRMQLVYATTRDPQLRKDLRTVLEDQQMSFAPSAELLREIAMCAVCTQDAPRRGRAGLCATHRSRWNLESCMADEQRDAENGEALQTLVRRLLASADGGVQLLAAFDRQRRALGMVLEAHSRGAVQLPESVAASVEKAFASAPGFQPSQSRPAVPQAS
jgi:hypothetical protein